MKNFKNNLYYIGYSLRNFFLLFALSNVLNKESQLIKN